MPTPDLSDELAQQALDAFVENRHNCTKAAKALGVPRKTLANRKDVAIIRGLKPTRMAPEPSRKPEKLGPSHCVIPDVQAKDGVPLEHMGWIGNYLVEKQPDVIIQIGDLADLPSLSTHNKPLEQEGKRYLKDIAAVRKAQQLLFQPIEDWNRTRPPEQQYHPRRVLTKGNHEYRIERTVNEHPWLQGKIDEADLGFQDYGWEVHDFLEVVEIDGVSYSHYFITGNMGRPCNSAAVLLKNRGRSATMGHTQFYDLATSRYTLQRALFCGTCYLHDETYLTRQGNNVRRSIIMKHEVHDGQYDLMEVSLKFLRKRYS